MRLLVLAGLVAISGCSRDYLVGTSGAVPSAPAPSVLTCPGPGERSAQAEVVAASFTPQRARVERVGQQLLVANPQLGFRPTLLVMGWAEPSISHAGSQSITVSEGLVDSCRSDAQLAAVLCFELARMSAERRTHAKEFGGVSRESEPMPALQFGRDGGSIGESDQYYKAELAKLGYDRPRRVLGVEPQEPTPLARQLLSRAGYAESELDTALPLVQSADRNGPNRRTVPSQAGNSLPSR